MGSGASAAAKELLASATTTDLTCAVASLSTENQQKLREALNVETPGTAKWDDGVKRMEEHLATVEAAAGRNDLCKDEAETKFKLRYPGLPYQDTENTYFSDLLKRQCLAVVKASYFHKCLAEDKPFQDREKIPEEFIFAGEEVVRKWTEHGAKFLVIISYGWLSAVHPDPDLFHLKRLARVLTEIENTYRCDCGVILDFCSLWQKHGKDETRSDEQVSQFKEGLSEINTPYGHEEVTAVKLMAVPESDKRKYHYRGWTLFESTIIDAKAASFAIPNFIGHPMFVRAARKFNTLTFIDTFDPVQEPRTACDFLSHFSLALRSPPLAPEAFRVAMEARSVTAKEHGVTFFTNGKEDQPFVLGKYEKAFTELVATKSFIFSHLRWGPEEMGRLAEVLKSCQTLEKLDLNYNKLGEAGAAKLAEALPSLPNLTDLNVGDNDICTVGAAKLSDALPSLPNLTRLSLSDNSIGDAGAEKLADALPSLPNLTRLFLRGSSIGKAGAEKLADALPSLPNLMDLDLRLNSIGDAGAEKLKAAAPRDCNIFFE